MIQAGVVSQWIDGSEHKKVAPKTARRANRLCPLADSDAGTQFIALMYSVLGAESARGRLAAQHATDEGRAV